MRKYRIPLCLLAVCGAFGLVGCDYDKLSDIDVSELEGDWVAPGVYDALTIGDLVQRAGDGGSSIAFYGPDSVAYVEYRDEHWASRVGCNDTACSVNEAVPFNATIDADVPARFYKWEQKSSFGAAGTVDQVYEPSEVTVERIRPYACINFDPNPSEPLDDNSETGPGAWKRKTRLVGEASVNGGPWVEFDAPFRDKNRVDLTDSLSAINCPESFGEGHDKLEGEGLPVKVSFRNLVLQGAEGHDVSGMTVTPGFAYGELLLSEAKGDYLYPWSTYKTPNAFKEAQLGSYRDETGAIRHGPVRIPVDLFRYMTQMQCSFSGATIGIETRLPIGVDIEFEDLSIAARYVEQVDPNALEVIRYELKYFADEKRMRMVPCGVSGEELTAASAPLRVVKGDIAPRAGVDEYVDQQGRKIYQLTPNFKITPSTESSDGRVWAALTKGNSNISELVGHGPFEFVIPETAKMKFKVHDDQPSDGRIPVNVGVIFTARVPFDGKVERMSIGSEVQVTDAFPADVLDYLKENEEGKSIGDGASVSGSVRVHFKFTNSMPFSFYTKVKFLDKDRQPIMANGQELDIDLEEVTTTSTQDKPDGSWPENSSKRLLVAAANTKAGTDPDSNGEIADGEVVTDAEATLTYEEYKALSSEGANGGAAYMHLYADAHSPDNGTKQVKVCKDDRVKVAIGVKVHATYKKNDENE